MTCMIRLVALLVHHAGTTCLNNSNTSKPSAESDHSASACQTSTGKLRVHVHMCHGASAVFSAQIVLGQPGPERQQAGRHGYHPWSHASGTDALQRHSTLSRRPNCLMVQVVGAL